MGYPAIACLQAKQRVRGGNEGSTAARLDSGRARDPQHASPPDLSPSRVNAQHLAPLCESHEDTADHRERRPDGRGGAAPDLLSSRAAQR